MESSSRTSAGVFEGPSGSGGDPFAELGKISSEQLWLERALGPWTAGKVLPGPLRWLETWTGGAITVGQPEILWRASGLQRAGLTAQFTAPRLATRLALGVELPLAHAIVDRLLDYHRPDADTRLQLTPVEWGIWSFLMLRVLDSLESSTRSARGRLPGDPGPLSVADMTLDRVGPDPFDVAGLGSMVTFRWSVRVDTTTAGVRLWLSESVARMWIAGDTRPPVFVAAQAQSKRPREVSGRVSQRELSSVWRAEAGIMPMPQGLRRLRVGGVLPLSDKRLIGTPASPSGPIDLVLDLPGERGRYRIATRPVADAGGRLLRLNDRPIREPGPRSPRAATPNEGKTMSQPHAPVNPAAAPLDVPVTLVVELGRVNLTLEQLADLKAGDVVELNRQTRAPVELTSNGRLVARGELILIDADLGVRVTSVFL